MARQFRNLVFEAGGVKGIVFRHDEPPQGRPIKRFPDYARALIGALGQVQEGIQGAEDYFRWFEDPCEELANRLPGGREGRKGNIMRSE